MKRILPFSKLQLICNEYHITEIWYLMMRGLGKNSMEITSLYFSNLFGLFYCFHYIYPSTLQTCSAQSESDNQSNVTSTLVTNIPRQQLLYIMIRTTSQAFFYTRQLVLVAAYQYWCDTARLLRTTSFPTNLAHTILHRTAPPQSLRPPNYGHTHSHVLFLLVTEC